MKASFILRGAPWASGGRFRVCQHRLETLEEALVGEIGGAAALAGDDAVPKPVVEGQSTGELGSVLEILWRELDACAAQRLRYGTRRICQNRHARCHGFDQWRAEAFVLAH